MSSILIRPLVIDDALVSWKWRNDPEVWKFTGRKPNIYVTESIEKKWIQEKLLESDSKRFAIIANGNYVGNIQLTSIIDTLSAEYHIFIGEKSYWGKGVATKATELIIDYAKHSLNIKEIFLRVHQDNHAAIKVYTKFGFIKSELLAEKMLLMIYKY